MLAGLEDMDEDAGQKLEGVDEGIVVVHGLPALGLLTSLSESLGTRLRKEPSLLTRSPRTSLLSGVCSSFGQTISTTSPAKQKPAKCWSGSGEATTSRFQQGHGRDWLRFEHRERALRPKARPGMGGTCLPGGGGPRPHYSRISSRELQAPSPHPPSPSSSTARGIRLSISARTMSTSSTGCSYITQSFSFGMQKSDRMLRRREGLTTVDAAQILEILRERSPQHLDLPLVEGSNHVQVD